MATSSRTQTIFLSNEKDSWQSCTGGAQSFGRVLILTALPVSLENDGSS